MALEIECTPRLSQPLMDGVWLRPLEMHVDDRGSVTELFRDSWKLGPELVQWNLVSSRAGIVRGVHFHLIRHDFLCVVSGRASVGLYDVRRSSTTYKKRLLVEMTGEKLSAITIPPGVVHGFYSNEDSLLACGFSEQWDPGDDFGCHWADPELAIPWPVTHAYCSDKDDKLPPFKALVDQLPNWLG
jgi:dTDP-4-dehydrorhamnose 3,5-epimerase